MAKRRSKAQPPPHPAESAHALTEEIYLSVDHPDFHATESLFVARFVLKHPRGRPLAERDLLRYVARLRDRRRSYRAVYEFVKKVGPDVLMPAQPYWEPAFDLASKGMRSRIRELIHSRIREHYDAARWGVAKDRKAAWTFFEQFGCALAGGPQRGKNKESAIPDRTALREFYYRRLFRLGQARMLMSLEVRCPRARKIAAVANACGLPVEDLQDHMLTELGEWKQPVSIEAQARLWTGIRFGIKQGAVANILTIPTRRHSSRSR